MNKNNHTISRKHYDLMFQEFFFSDPLLSFLFLSLTWRCMEGESISSWGGIRAPTLTPHHPHKAEWQVSGLAKWWNDDPIMRSDSKMRGIRQWLGPSLTSTASPPYTYHAASCKDDDWSAWDGSQETHIDFFLCFIKNSYLGLHPQDVSMLTPWLVLHVRQGIEEIILPFSVTRRMTWTIISESTQ